MSGAGSGKLPEVRAPEERLLGQILCRRGVMSERALDLALIRQKGSRRRLGEVLLESGSISSDELADALAEQLQGVQERPETGLVPALLDRLGPQERPGQPGDAILGRHPEAPSAAGRENPSPSPPPPWLSKEFQTWQSTVAYYRLEAGRAGQELRRTQEQVEALSARVDVLEEQIARQDSEPLRLQAHSGDGAPIAVAEAEAAATPSDDDNSNVNPADPPEHLCFVPTASGYELITRSGSPPRKGETLRHANVVYEVIRAAGSPLPSDHRPCAYLQRSQG